MNVLQIVGKPQRRGAEVFAFQLNEALRRQGHRAATVYLYPHETSDALPLRRHDHLLGAQENHIFEKIPGVHPAALFRLKRYIAAFGADIVQANGGRTVKYGAFAQRLGSRAALIYRNIGDPAGWVRTWYHALFYRQLVMPYVDGLVSISEGILENVNAFYPPFALEACIPNGIDPAPLRNARANDGADVRAEAETPLDAPVLLFIGSLTAEKRVDRLLRVAARVHRERPDVHVWIVGDGALRPELEWQAQAPPLAAQVRFLGVQQRVAPYLKAADLFLLTSDTEGIPAVVLEAGLAELPVVATRVGGLPECVRDGETAVLVDPDEEDEMARHVLRLLNQPARRAEMGTQAKDWVQEHFTIDEVAERYAAFYREVLGRGRGRKAGKGILNDRSRAAS